MCYAGPLSSEAPRGHHALRDMAALQSGIKVSVPPKQ